MLKCNKLNLLIIIILPLLILSCWGNSTPTSDKTKAYIVSGTVIDKSSIGIADVTVHITGTNFSLSDTTLSDGAFAFENVKSGSYKVKAQKDSCFFKPGNIDISIAADIDTLRFTSADNCIHGRILDILTDKAAPGVMVTLRPITKKPDTTLTDSNGEYWFYDKIKAQYGIKFDSSLDNYSPSYHSTRYYPGLYPSDFSNNEIIIPDRYVSFEKIKFTKAVFSKETKNFTIEWTASESKKFNGYTLCIKGSPFEYVTNFKRTGFGSNKAVINIDNSSYFGGLWDNNNVPGEIFFIVCPWYYIMGVEDSDFFDSFIWSDQVNVRIN